MGSQGVLFGLLTLITLTKLLMAAIYDNTQRLEFTDLSVSQAILLNNDLVLNCSANHLHLVNNSWSTVLNDTLFYQWYFQNQPVAESLHTALVFHNHSLFVPQVTQQHLGQYKCSVWPLSNPNTNLSSPEISVVAAYLDDFVTDPVNASVDEDTPLTLFCVSGLSAPSASLYWQKDGSVFTEGVQSTASFGEPHEGGARQQTSQLYIDRVQLTHAGSYQCVGVNPLSHASVSSETASVFVHAKPRAPYISRVIQSDIILPANSPAVLDCPITGQPQPELEWYKDGFLLENSSRISMFENGTIYFSSVEREDKGLYYCVGINDLGSVGMDPVNISAAFLGENFHVSPVSATPLSGQQLTLSCLPPVSHPPARIEWYHNDRLVTDTSGEFAVTISPGQLHFSNIQMTDSGSYVCIAVNDFSIPSSRSTSPVHIEVSGSASLLEPPLPQTLIKGDLLRLLCKVTGVPFPAITWYKNDELIKESNDTSRVSLRINNQELLIEGVNKLDEGRYRCTASNVYGSAYSSGVPVTVLVPPEIVTSLSPVAATEGSSVQLPCSFYGDPTPSVQWLKDGLELIPMNSRFTPSDNGLNITHLSRSDAGVYRCVGTNEAGTKSTEGPLLVHLPPDITSLPDSISFDASHPLDLNCDATGQPVPSVTWTYNGSSDLPPGFILLDRGQRLRHLTPTLSLSGLYTCTATNILGNMTKSVHMVINEVPQIDFFGGNTQLDKGKDLMLSCRASGTPTPFVKFYKDGREVTASANKRVSLPASDSVRIRFVNSDDSGTYTCKASSVAGTSQESIYVTVVVEPHAPELLAVHPVSASSINVSWSLPAENVLSYSLQYKIGYAEAWVSAGTTSVWYEVDGLLPATHYVFRVAAKNHIGTGNYSQILGTSTYQSAPGAPIGLSLTKATPTSLLLQWQQPLQTNGKITMYQLQYSTTHYSNSDDFSVIVPSTKSLTEYNLTGLLPYSSYACHVRAGIVREERPLWGKSSPVITFTTVMTVPASAPVSLNVTASNPRSLYVSWPAIPQLTQNGPLLGYIIRYHIDGQTNYQEISTNDNTTQVTINELLPWQLYVVQVAGYNAVGKSVFGDEVKQFTLPEAPSGSPINVQARAVSSTEILVQWQEVVVYQRNSDISGYTLVYKSVAQLHGVNIVINGPHITNKLLQDLKPYTTYAVELQAFTTQLQDGLGPFSRPVYANTHEDIPGTVANLTVQPFITSLLLSWEPPVSPNGRILGYSVSYFSIKRGKRKRYIALSAEPLTVEVGADDTDNVSVTDLVPGTLYHMSVMSHNSVGYSKPVNITAETEHLSSSTSQDLPPPVFTSSTTLTQPVTLQPAADEVYSGLAKEAVISPKTTVGGLSTAELVGLVVGVTLAVVLLVVMLILLLCWCYRRRQRHSGRHSRGSSFRQDAIFQNQGAGIPSAQHGDSKSHHRTSATLTSSEDTLSSTTSTSDNTKYSTNPPGHRNITAADSMRAGAGNEARSEVAQEKKRMRMVEGYISEAVKNKHAVSLKHRSHGGIDNPAYDMGDGGFGHHRPFSSLYDLPSELRTSSRRMQHMASNTAAAIATQRNLDTNVFADTDMLLGTDRVVIYNERTAL